MRLIVYKTINYNALNISTKSNLIEFGGANMIFTTSMLMLTREVEEQISHNIFYTAITRAFKRCDTNFNYGPDVKVKIILLNR